MENQFATYEQSLALKELGFDEDCFAWYNNKDIHFLVGEHYTSNRFIQIQKNCSAPLKSQVFKWFREKHNLEYQIVKSANGNYSVIIHKNTQEYLDKIANLPHGCLDEVVDLYLYEEAEDACIDKLIELIKNK